MDLSKEQKGIIRNLIRQEAHKLGYGKIYFLDNRPDWPDRLKKLDVLIRKFIDS